VTDKKKTEPPLFLDMDSDEALARFIGTDAKEVQESMDRAKQKKPPGERAAGRSSRKKRDS